MYGIGKWRGRWSGRFTWINVHAKITHKLVLSVCLLFTAVRLKDILQDVIMLLIAFFIYPSNGIIIHLIYSQNMV